MSETIIVIALLIEKWLQYLFGGSGLLWYGVLIIAGLVSSVKLLKLLIFGSSFMLLYEWEQFVDVFLSVICYCQSCKSWDVDFLVSKTIHCLENQPLLGPVLSYMVIVTVIAIW